MSRDNESSRVSELRSGIARSVSEMVAGTQGKRNNPRSFDDTANEPYTVHRQDYDREEPPKDEMQKYWRQYESTPIVRKPINSFANRVVEPGYYIQKPDTDLSDDEMEILQEINKWLKQCAYDAGEKEQDIYFLLKGAQIQREVRGTAIIEKVYSKGDRDTLMAMKMLNPETIEVNTRPGQAILLEEDDHEREDWDPPLTPEDKTAAYLQDLSDTQVSWGRSTRVRDNDDRYPNKIGFTKDDIVKLVRDNDVGDIFGTSRVESVSDRIDGLKQKLCDNDEAIASKAYPMWLFKFGAGQDSTPWPRDRINSFMKEHDMEQFRPGMKQGVRGDVEIETVSGEVADIAESLQFDLDWILGAMPMARQALGGFSSSSGGAAEVTGMAQERNIVRQINDARKELSHKFTPVIQEKAKELGMDKDVAEEIRFRVGDPSESRPSEDPTERTSRIEYHGVNDGEKGGQTIGDGENPITNVPPEQIPDESADEDEDKGEDSGPSDSDIGPFGDRRGIVEPTVSSMSGAELAESDLLETDDELHSLLQETAQNVREKILDAAEQRYEDAPKRTAYNIVDRANSYIDRATGRSMERDVENIVEGELRSLEHTREYSVQHSERVSMFTEDIVGSFYEMLDDMASDIRVQITRAAQDGDSFDMVEERVRNTYTDGFIERRSKQLSTMQLHGARETTKLAAFERKSDVVGVRIENEDASTAVCKAAHGVEAYFDEGSIGSQIRSSVPDHTYHDDFDPMPTTPPYHYGCQTTLVPIYEEDEDGN